MMIYVMLCWFSYRCGWVDTLMSKNFEMNMSWLVEVVNDTNYIYCIFWKIYAKYTGIFDLSDFDHIHMLVRVHYGDACYQISKEYVMIGWSYKRHKLHLLWHFQKKKYGKVKGWYFFLFSDLVHIHMVVRIHYEDATY